MLAPLKMWTVTPSKERREAAWINDAELIKEVNNGDVPWAKEVTNNAAGNKYEGLIN